MKSKEYPGKLVCIEGYWFVTIDKFPDVKIDMGDTIADLEQYEELMSDYDSDEERNR